MKSLSDYKNPFDAIIDFQNKISEYTGAPYAIVTDCCTHAIEIAFRIQKVRRTMFPSRTYLSVPMTMHKLDVRYHLTDKDWYRDGYYQFEGTNIWDYARHFTEEMYRPGTIQCVSFGRTKPMEIGKGGCILTDDPLVADRANRMRYDGRDIFKYKPWVEQKIFEVGFHYYMKPEEAVEGLNLLESRTFVSQCEEHFNYPDCRLIEIA